MSCGMKFYFKSIGICQTIRIRQYFHNFSRSSSRMPKNPKHAHEMKEQRLRTKVKNGAKSKGIPSEFVLNILSNGTRGFPGALYVFSGNNRYLFNCGEGTQRLAHEHKTKLAKLENIFFTYKNWENIGGLPGLTLTVQDIGIPELTLHGPPEIEDIYKMTKGFLVTKDIDIRKYNKDMFSDNAMTVQAVQITGSKVDTQEIDMSTENCEDVEWVDENRSSIDFSQTNKRLKTMVDNHQDVAVAYICKLHPKPGHLNLEECIRAGVPPGPLLGRLKNGEDVELADGRIVRSKDVTDPDEIGPLFIVLECPTVDFLPNLDSCTSWTKYQLGENASEENFPSVIVHFTPSSVANEPTYQKWMSRFSPSTYHLFLNHSQNGPNSIAVHRIQHQLHLLHPRIFPLLNYNLNSGFENVLMKYYVRPPKGITSDESGMVSINEFIKEVDNEEFKNEQEVFKKKLDLLKPQLQGKLQHPEIIFLGTGSSIPSKVRNTSGILINFSDECSLLMDVGEGIFGQLINHYGKDDINGILKNMHCIFVSHLHADHHLGLIQVMKERHLAFVKSGEAYSKLRLVAPAGIMKWLKAYHQEFEPICHMFDIISNEKLIMDKNTLSDDSYSQLLESLSIKHFATVPVKHCWQAYGITITNSSDYKIVYSGDTMPCQSLVEAGMNCDLLIHEATMEDDLEEDAAYKAHSTTSQAVDVGRAMHAKFIILTHFSQRYAKVPLLNDNCSGNVGIAFDNMTVRPCDLPILPLLHPALKIMFTEHYTDMENKRTKRQQKRERDKLSL